MYTNTMQKICFVIGPMNEEHMPKLRLLADQIIAPLLPEHVVQTPDQKREGKIMNQVIESCDGADLVIADLTGNNPNVLYEIGVLHSLGRICIPVKLKLGSDSKRRRRVQDPKAFDIAAYRHFQIDLENPEEAKAIIGDVISSSFENRRNKKHVSNPVIDYYGVPLAEISPASGLALGYYCNFVKNTVDCICKADLYEIVCGETPYGEDMKSIPRDRQDDIKLDILIPDRLEYAYHDYIGTLARKKLLMHAAIKSRSNPKARPMTMYIWPDHSALVDIPTTMNVMEQSIKNRLGARGQVDSEDEHYLRLEAEEIERFRAQLNLNIKATGTTSSFEIRRKTNIQGWREIGEQRKWPEEFWRPRPSERGLSQTLA
jgi:hypothetical protein